MMQQVETLPLLNRRKRKPGKEPVDQARKVRSGPLYKWAPGLVCEALIDRLAIGSRQMEEQQFDDIAELEKALEDDRPSYWPDLISTPATRERAAFLAKKRNGDCWHEGPGGRFLYRMGPQGVTVFDTSRWGRK